MRYAEIVNELTIGKVAPTVSTVDRSAPWVKKQMKVAADRTKSINDAETPADKLNFLYKETNGFTTKANIRVTFSIKNVSTVFKSYNPATGELVLHRSNSGKQISKYTTNISKFKYLGREKSPSSNGVVYQFHSDERPDTIERFDKPGFKSQAGINRTGTPDKFTNSPTLAKANNPFGI